jgi:hypothetical protein
MIKTDFIEEGGESFEIMKTGTPYAKDENEHIFISF